MNDFERLSSVQEKDPDGGEDEGFEDTFNRHTEEQNSERDMQSKREVAHKENKEEESEDKEKILKQLEQQFANLQSENGTDVQVKEAQKESSVSGAVATIQRLFPKRRKEHEDSMELEQGNDQIA